MNRLKELRNERQLSLRGLQIKTNLDYSRLAKYENETRDFSSEVLITLADFFEVTIDYLIGYNGFCLYCKYDKGNIFYKLSKTTYDQLKDYIYFTNDTRYIDLNRYLDINKETNASLLIHDLLKAKEMDKLFDNTFVTNEQVSNALSDRNEITLTIGLLEYVKNSIKA